MYVYAGKYVYIYNMGIHFCEVTKHTIYGLELIFLLNVEDNCFFNKKIEVIALLCYIRTRHSMCILEMQ